MLKQRVLTAVIAVTLLLLVLYLLPEPVARIVIGLVFVAAAWEWSQFLAPASLRLAFPALMLAAEVALSTVPDAVQFRQAVLLTGVGWWIAATVWIFYYPTPIPRALAWVCGFLVLLPPYLALDQLYLRSPGSLLTLLVLVWLADIGAYFAGRRFGRVKLAPGISPGKTWEGVIGGLLLSVTAAAAVAIWLGLSLVATMSFCVAVVLISIVGDLTVSMFKRSAGLKDSGRLFPGHGGVLDRVDSVCAAAPLFAVGSRLTGLH